jgi:hypothetical protein
MLQHSIINSFAHGRYLLGLLVFILQNLPRFCQRKKRKTPRKPQFRGEKYSRNSTYQGANHRKAQSDAAAAQNQADAVDQPVEAEAMFSLFRGFFAKIVIDHAVSHSIAPFAPM